MNCTGVEQALQSELATGTGSTVGPGTTDGTGRMTDELRNHLETCSQCRETWEAHHLLLPAVNAWRQTALRADLTDRVLAAVAKQPAPVVRLASPVENHAPAAGWLKAGSLIASAAVLLMAALLGVQWVSVQDSGLIIAIRETAPAIAPETNASPHLDSHGPGTITDDARNISLRNSVEEASRLLADEVLAPWAAVSPRLSYDQTVPNALTWWPTTNVGTATNTAPNTTANPSPGTDATPRSGLKKTLLADQINDAVGLLESLLPDVKADNG